MTDVLPEQLTDDEYANADLAALGLEALEAMSAVVPQLFQARKIGMQVVIPPLVEKIYVLKHGAAGKEMIEMLRGNLTL